MGICFDDILSFAKHTTDYRTGYHSYTASGASVHGVSLAPQLVSTPQVLVSVLALGYVFCLLFTPDTIWDSFRSAACPVPCAVWVTELPFSLGTDFRLLMLATQQHEARVRG